MSNKLFEIIPAIDILDGKCVRLTQGQYQNVEKFSDDPVEIARKWVDCGTKRLHIVDLNGAKDGYPVNLKTIQQIIKNVKTKIQVGGGIRTIETIKNYVSEGVDYLILGTKVFQDDTFLQDTVKLFGEKIIVGLDLKNKKVAVSGWQKTEDISLDELSSKLSGVEQIIYTDVSKDGTLSGPDIKSIEEVASSFRANIIVSGGIATLEDIVYLIHLKKNSHKNISGVILGKSLYKGTIDLKKAIELATKELTV